VIARTTMVYGISVQISHRQIPPIGRLGQSLLSHREFEMGVILSDCNSTRLWTELCMYTVEYQVVHATSFTKV